MRNGLYALLNRRHRHGPLLFKLVVISFFSTTVLILYSFAFPADSYRLRSDVAHFFSGNGRARGSCSPEAWSNGYWGHKDPMTNITVMVEANDALKFAGFEGCASDREYFWHLGADHPEHWDRFPEISSYEWVSGGGCNNFQAFDKDTVVRDMVENGGWLLIGDSVTENHFFSLSCLLSPHVRATPNYTENPWFERDWFQHLYLSPASPLVDSIHLPSGFDIATTPLVTFRRVDLLLSGEQLTNLYRKLYQPSADFPLFSDELYWTLPPSDYLSVFQKPLPEGNYGTLIVNTAGHWSTNLLAGFLADTMPENHLGMAGVLQFFEKAMTLWADQIQAILSLDKGTAGGRSRQVIVRSYNPGHEKCHDKWGSYYHLIPGPFKQHWSNWEYIEEFNRIFQEVTSSRKYPDIHFLSIERPGDLRPDAHTEGDCLHVVSGTGVIEGWSEYIWHYITQEISGKIR
ncbi:hypothetical protein C8Q75DRAFT_375836 [Abortiporus biennis]|nr:hypothetical protein C8Q75DRAFT_375836 [Abortiporus biennis]